MLSGLFSTNNRYVMLKVVQESTSEVDEAFAAIRTKAVEYLE
jgi:hypothetical protein